MKSYTLKFIRFNVKCYFQKYIDIRKKKHISKQFNAIKHKCSEENFFSNHKTAC